MDKNTIILSKIGCIYHPQLKKWPKEFVFEHAHILDVPRIVEHCLAAVGGYKFVDSDGYDFSDGTEAKTASVGGKTKLSPGVNTYRVKVTNVKAKNSYIRAIIYNQHKQDLDYFFIPPNPPTGYSYEPSKGTARLLWTWNCKNDSYAAYEQYRVRSFEEVASLIPLMQQDNNILTQEAA